MERGQQSFNPVNFRFSWEGDWYQWDSKAARVDARKARDAEAKRLKAAGFEVVKWTLPNQLVRRGGIGSGRPDVEFVSSVYMLDYRKAV